MDLIIAPKTREHLAAHAGIDPLLPEAWERCLLAHRMRGESAVPMLGAVLVHTADMGRVIGRTGVVASPTEGGRVLVAVRLGRPYASRIAPGTQGSETTLVTLVVRGARIESPSVRAELISAWAGEAAPREPWDRSLRTRAERAESEAYWERHALTIEEGLHGACRMAPWAEYVRGCR